MQRRNIPQGRFRTCRFHSQPPSINPGANVNWSQWVRFRSPLTDTSNRIFQAQRIVSKEEGCDNRLWRMFTNHFPKTGRIYSDADPRYVPQRLV